MRPGVAIYIVISSRACDPPKPRDTESKERAVDKVSLFLSARYRSAISVTDMRLNRAVTCFSFASRLTFPTFMLLSPPTSRYTLKRPLRRVRRVTHILIVILGNYPAAHCASVASSMIASFPVAHQIRIAAQLGIGAFALPCELA